MHITVRGKDYKVEQLTAFYFKPLSTFGNEGVPAFVREAEAARCLLQIAPGLSELGVRFTYFADGRIDFAMPLDYTELSPIVGALGVALAEKLSGEISPEKQAEAAPLLAGLQQESAKLAPVPRPKTKKQKRRDRQFAAR